VTAVAPLYDQELEALLDGDPRCNVKDCTRTAVAFVGYSCGHEGLMCGVCVAALRQLIATARVQRYGLICTHDGKALDPDATVIRPI
jgi:hypothetical protein